MDQVNLIDLDSNRKCAEVVSVRSPHEFWIRLEETKEEYLAMMERLQNDYRSLDDEMKVNAKGSFPLGLYCVLNQTLYEWHRCEVLSVNKNSALISYIDLGERDFVPLSALKYLKDSYKNIKRFAIECSLCNIEPSLDGKPKDSWCMDNIVPFVKLVDNKVVSVNFRFKSFSSVYYIDMYVKNVNVVDELIKLERAASNEDENLSIFEEAKFSDKLVNALETLAQVEKYVKAPIIKLSDQFEHKVKCTSVNSPYCFYLQLDEDLAEFYKFESAMQDYYNNSLKQSAISPLENPEPGQMCIAKFSEDSNWYRAVIDKIDREQNTASVFFIDYGNYDVSPASELLAINDQFISYPACCIKCCLANIKPIADQSSLSNDERLARETEIIDFVFGSITDNSYAKFLARSTSTNSYLVDLRVEPDIPDGTSFDLASILVAKNYATPKTKEIHIDFGREYEMNVIHTNSPFCFYAQLSSAYKESEVFVEEIQQFYSNEENLIKYALDKPKIGQFCIVKYSGDDRYYRAIIKEITKSKMARIFFVDYGNEEFVVLKNNSFLKLEDKFKEFPITLLKCCLDGIQPSIRLRNDKSLLVLAVDFMFDYLMGEHKSVAVFKSKSADDCYYLNLSVRTRDGKAYDMAELLIQENFAERIGKIQTQPAKPNAILKPKEKNLVKSTQEYLKLTKPIINQSGDSKASTPTTSAELKSYKVSHVELSAKFKGNFFVTHIETLNHFYVQVRFENNPNEWRRLSSDIQYFYERKVNLPQPILKSNNACVYYDDEKKSWNRALIRNVVDKDHCLIYLVDHGVTKYVNRALLREIYEKFLDFPCQAILASLEGLNEHESQNVDEKYFVAFKNIALDKELYGRVVEIVPDEESQMRYVVNLFNSSGDSIFSILMNDLDTTLSIENPVQDKLKPVFKSKLEETMVQSSILNDTTEVTEMDVSSKPVNQVDSIMRPVEQEPNRIVEKVQVNGAPAAMMNGLRPKPVDLYISPEESPFPVHEVTPFKAAAPVVKLIDSQPAEPTRVLPQQQQAPPSVKVLPPQKPAKVLAPKLESVKIQPQPEPIKAPEQLKSSLSQLRPTNNVSKTIRTQINESMIQDKLLYNANNGQPTNIFNATIVSTEGGLKNLYFNLEDTVHLFRTLGDELEKDLKNLSSLKPLKLVDLKFNQFYLVKYRDSLYRALLIAPTKKIQLADANKLYFVLKLVDYGTNVEFGCQLLPQQNDLIPSISISFYEMKEVYMNVGAFALHCRLTMAESIENTWDPEERTQFFEQIKIGNKYKIKLLTCFEPYVFEFIEEKSISSQFGFGSIIARMKPNQLEHPTPMIGSTNVLSLGTDFTISTSRDNFDTKNFYICPSQNSILFSQLSFFIDYMNLILDRIDQSILTPKVIRKGDIMLARCRSEKFLSRLRPHMRSLIENKWARVKIENIDANQSENKRTIKILYYDLGVEETFEDSLSSYGPMVNMFKEFEFMNMIVILKIWPCFSFKCSLDDRELTSKIALAQKENRFFDFNYFANFIPKMASKINQISINCDFSFNLAAKFKNNSTFLIDAYDSFSKKNLLDVIISCALQNINRNEFVCVVTHANSLDDFYVQKSDSYNEGLIYEIQNRITEKIKTNILQPLKLFEVGKICIAYYDPDEQFYRARIEKIDLNGKFEVFYVDYGNRNYVTADDLKEITADLVTNLPAGLAIKCELKLDDDPEFQDEENKLLFNEFFLNKINDYEYYLKFFVKHLSKTTSDHVYIVDLYERASKLLLIDLFKQDVLYRGLDDTTQMHSRSLMMTTFDGDDDYDDKAIAESINYSAGFSKHDITIANETIADSFFCKTNLNESISFAKKNSNESICKPLQKIAIVEEESVMSDEATKNSWNLTKPELKNFDYPNPAGDVTTKSILTTTEITTKKDDDDSWSLTRSDLRNYNYQNADESNYEQNTELYSTANENSMRFSGIESYMESTSDQTSNFTLNKEAAKSKLVESKKPPVLSTNVDFSYLNQENSDEDEDEPKSSQANKSKKVSFYEPQSKEDEVDFEKDLAANVENMLYKPGQMNVKTSTKNDLAAEKEQNVSSASNLSMNKTLLINNKSVKEFPDKSAEWSHMDKSSLSESIHLGDGGAPNKDVSRMPNESNWTIDSKLIEPDNGNDTITAVDVKNQSVSNFADNTAWSANESKAYEAHTINESDFSKWDKTITESEQPYHAELKGYLTNVNSLANFYVQPVGTEEKLQLILSELQTCDQPFKPLGNLVGSLCVAKYSVDNEYYRAKIMECLDQDKVRVYFIDYGNDEVCEISELKEITANLRTLEPMTVECKLYIPKDLDEFMQENNTINLLDEFKTFYDIELTLKARAILKNKQMDSKKPVAHEQTYVVDVFIGDENIKDRFMIKMPSLESPNFSEPDFTTPAQTLAALKSKHLNLLEQCLNQPTKECLLMNSPSIKLKAPFIQLNLQDQAIIKTIDAYFDALMQSSLKEASMDFSDGHTESTYFVYLPTSLVDFFKFKSPLARVSLKTNNEKPLVHLIDYGFEIEIESKALIRVRSDYLIEIPPAYEKFALKISNSEKISALDTFKCDHLNAIIKLLLNYAELNLGVLFFGASTISFNVEPDRTDCAFGLPSVKLIDPKREKLDLNLLIESCISVFSSPFVGNLTHFEASQGQFDCCHVSSVSTLKEIQKILRSSSYFKDSHEKPVEFQVGDFCLVDETIEPNVKSEADPSVDPSILNSETIMTSTQHLVCRGFILDQNVDKCVVLNIDSGKRITVNKRRLLSIDNLNNAQDKLSVNSSILTRILPFLTLRCKLKENLTQNESLAKLLKDSRFYGSKVKLNVLGDWSDSASQASNQLKLYNKYIQSEIDLNKVVDILADIDVNNEVHLTTSTNTKRKRDETLDQLMQRKSSISESDSDRKPIIKSILKTKEEKLPFYFALSYADSPNLFYLHSNDAKKNLEFIEEQVEMEAKSKKLESVLNSNEIRVNEVYGFFSKTDNKFYRVKIVNRFGSDLYEAFCMDYGFTKQIHLNDIIIINDVSIQQLAPLAICCKLAEFENVNDKKSALEAFLGLTESKPLMATIHKRFLNLNRIDNYLPIQSDNTKPIEVVLHLFKPDSAQAKMENHNKSYVEEYNSASEDLNQYNINLILRSILKQTKTESKKFRALDKSSGNPRDEPFVEIVNVYSPNQFYLRFTDAGNKLNEITSMLKSDYESGEILNLKEKDLTPALGCAIVEQREAAYYRAKIMSFKKKDDELLVKVFLIDTGRSLQVDISNVYPLLDKYYEIVPLAFECSLNFDKINERTSKDDLIIYTSMFHKLIELKPSHTIRFLGQITTNDSNNIKYVVSLLASSSKNRLDVCDVLKCLQQLFDGVSTIEQLKELDEEARLSHLLESIDLTGSKRQNVYGKQLNLLDSFRLDGKRIPFKEHELPLNVPFKVRITNMDTSKQIGIVLSQYIEMRQEFLNDFQKWHRDNKSKLEVLFEKMMDDNRPPSQVVGLPCAVKSTQINKWCRGLITQYEAGSAFCFIYLVDYCKLIQVTNDRIYKLNANYQNEPLYVYRCLTVDDPSQKAKLNKYMSLLQTPNANPEGEGVSEPHISLDNIEIQVKCVDRKMASIGQLSLVESSLYTIEIMDFKRLRCDFAESPILKPKSVATEPSSKMSRLTGTKIDYQQEINYMEQVDTNNYTEYPTQMRSLTIVERLSTNKNDYDNDETTENKLGVSNQESDFRYLTKSNQFMKMPLNDTSNSNIAAPMSQKSVPTHHLLAVETTRNESNITNILDEKSLYPFSICESTHITHADSCSISSAHTQRIKRDSN